VYLISKEKKELDMKILKLITTATLLLMFFTIVTGLLYPLAVTGLAQILFPGKANGSLLARNGKVYGSELIGQPFSNQKYFWGRLSATGSCAYNGGASAGSNYGPLNPALIDAAKKRIQDLKSVDSLRSANIPIDLVTASASGLDPHISIASALYQIPRVAHARGLSEGQVRSCVAHKTQGRQMGFLGEPAVNVLMLNGELDDLQNTAGGK
jgi:potassium-transporting ATPase KdpC subunit